MTTATETHQLTIARAIAYEIEDYRGEPGWATESMGMACSHPMSARFREQSGLLRCSACRGDVNASPTPRPLTALADARAAWVASGGAPERGPCLAFRSDGLEWSISDNAEWMHVRSGRLWASRRASDAWEWHGIGTTEDAALLARIIRAVEDVTRGT